MKRHSNYLLVSLMIVVFSFNNCKKKNEKGKIDKAEKDYKYERAIIQYDLGDNIRQDVEVYISRNNDTIGYQKFTYNNNILDTTRSRFYKLNLFRDAKTDLINGRLNYYFDSIGDGSVDHFSFSAVSRHNKKTDFVEFENYDLKNNSLEFSFEHDNDTLMGFIYVQHTKDTIENGEKMVRIREILLAVDNYNRTDNPFIEIKL